MAIQYVSIGSSTNVFGYDDAVTPKSASYPGPIAVGAPVDAGDAARLEDIGSSVYPIGSIYLSVVSTSPSTLLGFGTWARIAEGQFLVGFKTADANFGTVEATGGSITATHDNNHTGTAVADHSDHVHTGSTSHTVTPNIQGALAGNVTTDGAHDNTGGATTTLSHSVTQPDAHGDHDILNPFFVIYAWKRTA